MRCESARRELSDAIDGPAPAFRDVLAHVESCPACSQFASELHRLHQLVRLEPAPSVPDLAPSIMTRVRRERMAGQVALVDAPRRRSRGPVGRRLVAGAVAAGLVVGFVLGAGALFPGRGGGTEALASQIPHRLIQAAVSLRGYHASFDVTERNFSAQVPVRSFRAEIWFRAPESFKVVVRDTSHYPSPGWPRNDFELVTNGRTWRATGPNPCPASELPACYPDTIDRTVVHRAPFDDLSPMPTDVIVPMTVLAAQNKVRVLGPVTVGGRQAEAVSLSYEDATPLFAYLNELGSWRPFYPGDRVVVDLDRSTWFPLRYEVTPARGPERAQWSAQAGVRGDRPGHAVFQATVRSLSTQVPSPVQFQVTDGPAPVDERFHDSGVTRIPPDMRVPPTSGLRPVRFGWFEPSAGRPYRELIAAYSSGLAWVTVARITGWRQHHLFGVGEFPERMAVPDGGVGYFEPATSSTPRHLAMHSAHAEYLVSTNLPPSRLLALSGELGVRATPAPAGWFVRGWSGGKIRSGLTPDEAVANTSFPAFVPRFLPPGYRAASAETVDAPRVRGVTIVYREAAAQLDGVGLTLYQAVGESLPPPEGVSEQAVQVGGVFGRWSPDAHLLEWVDHGVYRSLSSPAFSLSTLLRVADSLAAPGAR